MAEETKTTVTETTGTTTEPATPTVEELMAQLAEANARADRNKTELDKALKENGEVKKSLRAKLSAEEQAEAAQKEAQELADKERDELRAELNQIKAEKAYKGVADDKSIQKLIEAVSNADHAEIAKIIEVECKRAVSEAEKAWLKDRPRVQHGNDSLNSAEQIMAIADRDERLRQIALHPELFS